MEARSNGSAKLLDRKSAALVVLDVQSKLVPAIFEPKRVIRNCQLLMRLGQVLGLPTVLTTHYPKGLGKLIPELTSNGAGLQPFEKTTFGCFGNPDFLRHLKARAPQANTLLVAGLESHICIAQTVLGALGAGYLVHVAADATSSRTAENWRIGLKRMERAGAVISSTEMMIYELIGKSDSPEFKTLLPLLK